MAEQERMTEKRMTEAVIKLAHALPPNHPAYVEAAAVMTAMWTELGNADVTTQALNVETAHAKEVIAAHAELDLLLDDWRRGIRDWGEVDEVLKRTRAAAGKLGEST